jgi:uncharacterized membrane protein YcaP (DUF421 family)
MIWVVVVVRLIGLRSFSKMTAFDFISTIASGSLLASAARSNSWGTFFQPTLAIFALLGFQYCLARLRLTHRHLEKKVLNQPAILFADGRFRKSVMEEARVTEDDLWAKIRQSNVKDVNEITAIVLETTGDVSILHGSELDKQLLTGVTPIRENTEAS